MRRKNTGKLIALLAACFIGQAAIGSLSLFGKWEKDFSTNRGDIPSGLSPEQLIVALSGFREMIAGILWVKADSFFDTGNYDAILPMIRLVTWLDPHQIDVYATGMWHIGYNFTDEEQRSDRRYIPSAIALGKEGSKQNDSTYELFFETGWLWFHKVDDDYQQAVKWFEDAHQRKDIIPARKNVLARAYQRNGQINESLALLNKLFNEAQQRVDDDPNAWQARSGRDTLENNIDTLLVRMSSRGEFARQRGESRDGPYDTNPPFDVGFSAQVSVVEPRVLQVQGTWNVLPVGTRIRIVLRDADYPGAKVAELDWDGATQVNLDPPRDRTYMQDQLFVRNRRFNKRIDMSKDPTMYPFTSKDYIVEFYYNPRSASEHIQDKFSWNGDGMTDKNFINEEVRPGTRVMYAKLELTRDELLRRGEWQDKVPVIQTVNYKAPIKVGGSESDIIQVPSLLADPSKPK